MPISPYDDITAYAAAVAKPSSEHMRVLLTMCGYPADRTALIREQDAVAVWDAARRGSPSAAVSVTSRIARANGVRIDATPAPQVPSPFPDILPPPSPDTLGADLNAVLQRAKTYADGLHADTKDAIKAQGDNFLLRLPDAIDAALSQRVALNITITRPDAPPVPLGLSHNKTPRIIRALSANLNVYLHGPAGSGKTTAGKQCAEAFGLPFYTAAKVESEYLLLGFRDAKGDVVRTPFREAYEHGGVFLFDELDASSPGAIVALNMALANGLCPFPDGTIKRHKDFKCVAAGNTTLTGANRQYAGRSQMDGASIDRFYFLEFGYDEALEYELAANKDWCRHVQRVRKVVAERGLNHLVTPRATYDGSTALAIGDTWQEAEMSCIFKGLDAETVRAVRRQVSNEGMTL